MAFLTSRSRAWHRCWALYSRLPPEVSSSVAGGRVSGWGRGVGPGEDGCGISGPGSQLERSMASKPLRCVWRELATAPPLGRVSLAPIATMAIDRVALGLGRTSSSGGYEPVDRSACVCVTGSVR